MVSTHRKHCLPQLLPTDHQSPTSGCDNTLSNPTPCSQIKYSNTLLPVPREHASHRTPNSCTLTGLPPPPPCKPCLLATYTHNARKCLVQSCSDSKRANRTFTPIHSTDSPQYPTALCIRTIHSTFPRPLTGHLPHCPPTCESFTPGLPTDHPSRHSPLVDSPPTPLCRRLSPHRPTMPPSGGSCLIMPHAKHPPGISHQWTVHPNTSAQIGHPAPIPPMPTPSVFLTTAYCRPAWGLTHSGDLTESSHRLGSGRKRLTQKWARAHTR